MTTPQIDHLTGVQRATIDAAPAPDAPVVPAPVTDGRSPLADVLGTVIAAIPPASGITAAARSGASMARRGAGGLWARLPGTLRTTRAGAAGAVGALQALPDPTLRSLAATSVGLGVGLYLSRARRLAIVAGMVPAILMGAAIAVRPLEPSSPAEAGG